VNLHYKIVEVWPSDHLIVARYWTDAISEESLATDSNRTEDGTPVRCRSDVSLTLPIPAPTGNDLEKLIIRNAPIHWLKTMEKIMSPEVDTSMEDILSLRNQQFTVSDVEKKMGDEPTNILTDEEIEEMIQNITANKTE
jgi:hypothetical protein